MVYDKDSVHGLLHLKRRLEDFNGYCVQGRWSNEMEETIDSPLRALMV
jgi:hypothetical protein